MRTIAVIGRKGGCGKTTIAVHLAVGLHLRGRATVLADTDPQRSVIEVFKGRREPGPAVVASAAPKLFTLQLSMARAGNEALVIDTPAVLEEEVAQAVILADLALLVVRPTFLDLTAAVRTSDIIRRLRKPGLVVLNQAPPARETVEAPAVARATEALELGVGVGYQDAKITQGGPLVATPPGSPVQQVPDWTGNASALYTVPVTSEWDFQGGADWSYIGRSFSANNDPANPRERPAYRLLDARLALTKHRLEIAVVGKNLTNEAANLGDSRSVAAEVPGRPRIFVNQPRTVGLEFREHF